MNNVVYSIMGVNKISWFDQYFGKVCLLHYSSEFICASIVIVCLRDYVAPIKLVFDLVDFYNFVSNEFDPTWEVQRNGKGFYKIFITVKLHFKTGIIVAGFTVASRFYHLRNLDTSTVNPTLKTFQLFESIFRWEITFFQISLFSC